MSTRSLTTEKALVAEVLNEVTVEEKLMHLLLAELIANSEWLLDIETFEEAGVEITKNGIAIETIDGKEFLLSITKTR